MLDLTENKTLKIKLHIEKKKLFKAKNIVKEFELALPSQEILLEISNELSKEEQNIDKITLVQKILNNNISNEKLTRQEVESLNIFDCAKIIQAYNDFIVECLNSKN